MASSFDHLERVKKKLEEKGFKVVGEKPMADGIKIEVEGGAILNVFKDGRYNFGGVRPERLKILFE